MVKEKATPSPNCHFVPIVCNRSIAHKDNVRHPPHNRPQTTPNIPWVKALVGANNIASMKKKKALWDSIMPSDRFIKNIPMGSKSPVTKGRNTPYRMPTKIHIKIFRLR